MERKQRGSSWVGGLGALESADSRVSAWGSLLFRVRFQMAFGCSDMPNHYDLKDAVVCIFVLYTANSVINFKNVLFGWVQVDREFFFCFQSWNCAWFDEIWPRSGFVSISVQMVMDAQDGQIWHAMSTIILSRLSYTLDPIRTWSLSNRMIYLNFGIKMVTIFTTLNEKPSRLYHQWMAYFCLSGREPAACEW